MSSPTSAPDTSIFSMLALGLSFEMWYEGLSAPAIANLCAGHGIGISAEGVLEVATAVNTLRVLEHIEHTSTVFDTEKEGDASSKKEAAALKRKASVFRSRAVRCIAEVLKKRCVFASEKRYTPGHVGCGRQACAHVERREVNPNVVQIKDHVAGPSSVNKTVIVGGPSSKVALVSQDAPVVDQRERAVPLARQMGSKSSAREESDDEGPDGAHADQAIEDGTLATQTQRGVRWGHRAEAAADGDDGGAHAQQPGTK